MFKIIKMNFFANLCIVALVYATVFFGQGKFKNNDFINKKKGKEEKVNRNFPTLENSQHCLGVKA